MSFASNNTQNRRENDFSFSNSTVLTGMASPRLQILNPEVPHTFLAPIKKINEGQDVSHFLVSQAYSDVMTFLLQLNRAMFPCSAQTGVSKQEVPSIITNLKNLFGELEKMIDEVPPDPGPRRFGNISFRGWHQNLQERASSLIQDHLPPSTYCHPRASSPTATQELTSYFLSSFGSSQRLDYGTGHELSFLAFLGCIWKLGGFPSSSPASSSLRNDDGQTIERLIVLEVFNPYFHLIRRLIKTYTLEPAGSHGVWGLDDHSFLPYIFGSAQYSPTIPHSGSIPMEGSHPDAPNPSDITNPRTVSQERSQNLYFGAIGFINDVKKGPFWEHSPMLFDISGVKSGWAKINKGMLKMYNAEVLSKFPVVQHFYFGSLFSWERDPDAVEAVTTTAHVKAQPAAAGQEGHGMSTRVPMAAMGAPWARPSVGATAVNGQMNSGRAPPFVKGGPAKFMPPPTGRSMPPATQAPWAKPP